MENRLIDAALPDGFNPPERAFQLANFGTFVMKGQLSTFVLVAFASLPMLLLYGLLSAKIADDVAWTWVTVFFEYIGALFVVALVLYLTRPRLPPK